MADQEVLKTIEQQKMDLVKLRIKNKFYDKEDILKQVVSAIFKDEIRRDN